MNKESTTDSRSPQRYITGHRPDGKSIHLQANPQIWRYLPEVGQVSRSYAVEKVPVDLQDGADIQKFSANLGVASHTGSEIVVGPEGANLSVVVLQPGGSSTMHQTKSIDFSICVAGTIDHVLDSGEVVRLEPGDHIVQRGTMHKWINASQTKEAKFVAVTLPCSPLFVAGKEIEEVHRPREPAPRANL